MVRWTETRDSYRATLLPGGIIGALLCAGTAMMSGAVYWGLFAVRVGSGVGLATALGAGAIILYLLAAYFWWDAPWIEIPLHGGPVDWGRAGSCGGRTPGAPSYFDVEAVPGPIHSYRLVAVMEDGDSRVSIGWQVASPAKLAPLVGQLNQHFGREETPPLRVPFLVRKHRERQWATCIVSVLFLLVICTVLYWVMLSRLFSGMTN